MQAAAGALAAVLSAAAASSSIPSTLNPALDKQGQLGQQGPGASTAAFDRDKVLEQQKRNKEREEKRKDEEAKEAVRRQIAADKLVADHRKPLSLQRSRVTIVSPDPKPLTLVAQG
jgi:hypothetical protein